LGIRNGALLLITQGGSLALTIRRTTRRATRRRPVRSKQDMFAT
jgi:hypothetical protein